MAFAWCHNLCPSSLRIPLPSFLSKPFCFFVFHFEISFHSIWRFWSVPTTCPSSLRVNQDDETKRERGCLAVAVINQLHFAIYPGNFLSIFVGQRHPTTVDDEQMRTLRFVMFPVPSSLTFGRRVALREG